MYRIISGLGYRDSDRIVALRIVAALTSTYILISSTILHLITKLVCSEIFVYFYNTFYLNSYTYIF
jgi:hypothetical protein